MELHVRFTTRPSPGTGIRVLVLVIVIITVLVARDAGYEPGTAFPAMALSAMLAALQAASTLARSGPASLPPGTGVRALS